MSEITIKLATDVVAKLAEFGVTDETILNAIHDLGVATLEDLAELTAEDLTEAGVKTVQARKLVKSFAPESASAPATNTANTMQFANFSAAGILPAIPDDSSWLNMLRTGGVSKVEQSTVIAALRAMLAQKAGLFEIPDKLVKFMEAFADENEEPVGETFFKLRKLVSRRAYSEVFEGIDGLDGKFVTEARKKQLFGRIEQYLWPALLSSYQALDAWVEAYNKQTGNPAMMMSMLSSAMGGNPAMPIASVTQDTSDLRMQAEDINNAINKTFAGTGIQISAALAYDATQIRSTLQNEALPASIGATNREQMLKKLGTNVTSNYALLETNLITYVLGFMDIEKVPADNTEVAYFSALWMLGQKIFTQAKGNYGITSLTGESLV